MIGILIGDLVGSAYEGVDIKGYGLPLLTPSSVLTDDSITAFATAESILNDEVSPSAIAATLRRWVAAHPGRGYGEMLEEWVRSERAEPNAGASLGNGAGIRTAIASLLIDDPVRADEFASRSGRLTHSSEAMELAHAISICIRGVRGGQAFDAINEQVKARCFIDLTCDLDRLHREAGFSPLMEATVAPALYIGLTSETAEQAMRRVLYIGGDTDSIGAMAGAMIDARGLSWPMELLTAAKEAVKGLRYRRDAEKVLSFASARHPSLKLAGFDA